MIRASTLPETIFVNRQRHLPVSSLDLPRVRKVISAALPAVVAGAGAGTPLPTLPQVSFVLVSDGAISRVHARFLGDASPTDVITFLHGEIIVSVETAAREARVRRWPVAREIALYALHGLLHLAGRRDDMPETARAMHREQSKILRSAARGVW